MSPNLIFQCAIIAQDLSPVAGLLVINLEVNVKKWFLTFIKTVLPIIGISYCILGQISNPAYPDYWQFLLYSIAISVFIHFLQVRNPDKPTKVLGISLIVASLFSQYWEVPLFIFAHLGFPFFEYLGSIDQAYFLLVFWLALKFMNISIAKKDLRILSAPLILTIIAFYSNPIVFTYVTPLWFLVRCFSCLCLGKFFIERGVL